MEYQCSICLDRLFTADKEVSVTPCGHSYHKDCISDATKGDNKNCPICREILQEDEINKIHFNVFEELNYSDCSKETLSFFDKIVEYEADKRMTMVKIIKKLDKENISLKETYKYNCKSYRSCKVFLKGFQKEIKNLNEAVRELELTKDGLIAEIRRLKKKKKKGKIIKAKKSEVNKIEIGVNNFEDAIKNIEAIISKGLFIFYCLKNLLFMFN